MIDEPLLRKCLEQGQFHSMYMAAVSQLMAAMLSFRAIGINITSEIEQLSKRMAQEVASVAQSRIDINEILKEASKVGDSIVKKTEKSP